MARTRTSTVRRLAGPGGRTCVIAARRAADQAEQIVALRLDTAGRPATLSTLAGHKR